jgi:integrase
MLLFEKALERLSSLQLSVPKKYQSMYEVFLEVLKLEGAEKFLSVRHNKITASEDFMVFLSNYEKISALQRGAKGLYEFVEYLKNYGYLSKNSACYTLSKPMRQINRYHHFLPNQDFYLIDKVEEFERYVLNELPQTHLELAVYIALVYIEEAGWKEEALSRACLNDFFLINVQGYQCIIDEPLEDGFRSLKIYRIKKAWGLMDQLKESGKNLLFGELNTMKQMAKDEVNRYFGKKVSVNMIRNAFVFDAMMLESPAIVACRYKKVDTIALSVSELNYLYPQGVPGHLLEIEARNYELIGQHFSYGELDDYADEMYLDTEFDYDMKIAPLFFYKQGMKKIDFLKSSPRNLDQSTLDLIKAQFDKAIQYEKDTSTLMVLYYIRHLMERIYVGKKQSVGINMGTFAGYVGLLRKHLFSKLTDFEHIDEAALFNILDIYKANGAALESLKKFNFLVSVFFRFHNIEFQKYSISAKHVAKSLVFKEEIDSILKEIENRYKQDAVSKEKSYSKFYKYIVLQYQAFVILGFYSGMRLDEIRTRRHADIITESLYVYDHRIKDAVYSVDINVAGLKKDENSKKIDSFKSSNASRRVNFVIKNEKHNQIFMQFLEESAKKNPMYLFKDFDLVTHSQLDSVIKLSKIQILNDIIQQVTKRYATLHSLRHSYATWWFLERIIAGQNFNDALLNFSIEIGHATPDVTMRSYIHYELIEEVIAHERRS